MQSRPSHSLSFRNAAFASCIALCAVAAALGQQRPLTHNDYASWKNIQNQRLSSDGKYLAYALFPQEGDGELVVREISGQKEFRHSTAARPPPPRPHPPPPA